MHKKHVQWLTLIALAPLFFDHGTQAAPSRGLKCPALKASMHVDWSLLGGQDWLEGLQFPDQADICYALRYFPVNNTFAIQTKQGSAGPVKVLAFYKFRKQDDRRYLITHGSGSRFVVAFSTPMAKVPAKVMKMIRDAVDKSGEKRKVNWRRSPCMLKNTPEDPTDNLSLVRRKSMIG
uniref:Putative conserved secreted protein n=1 Tax=Rhipicephalus microplus TaxID=6941 RepID=A0A6G4ZUF0_RHIMP